MRKLRKTSVLLLCVLSLSCLMGQTCVPFPYDDDHHDRCCYDDDDYAYWYDVFYYYPDWYDYGWDYYDPYYYDYGYDMVDFYYFGDYYYGGGDYYYYKAIQPADEVEVQIKAEAEAVQRSGGGKAELNQIREKHGMPLK